MFFLNQEINPATTSNPESKSMNIEEHEHQTNKKKKKKTWTSPNQRATTRADPGKPTRNHTQTKSSKE